ncbi:MAG TPA: SIMPL domain-containing protein, partial [Candidatus Aquilonibacter sp.]|nr:SIMPL domain-containing protein [Candidatus Aquilonibacter sp.]
MKRQLVPLTLALVVLAALPVAAAAPTEISVTGSGSVAMMPDQATVNAQVQTTADTSAAAVDQNNRRYDAIVAAATRAGVARADITLSYYSMNYVPKPNPMPTGDTYERYGYTVTRSFAVKVRQIGKAGSVVDALSGAGATSIDGVAFGLANPQRARAQATERAVADARAKAEEVAKAAGLHIA